MITTCTRRLEFDAAHRLVEHEGLCAHLHGHRYMVDITCSAPLDAVGRVVDFSEIKTKVGGWIARNFDHASILNVADTELVELCKSKSWRGYVMRENPTAENIAAELLRVATDLLSVRVVRVRVWETPNCYADALAEPA